MSIKRRQGQPFVYAVEDHVLRRGKAAEVPSIVDAKASIVRWCERKRVPVPEVVRGRKGQGGWCADPTVNHPTGRISLQSHAPWSVVWHEAAHHICQWSSGSWVDHGHDAHFLDTFLAILACELPPSYSERMAKALGRNRPVPVRWASPEPRSAK